MNKLSLLDLAFFLTESEASPKHVGGLMVFKKPDRAVANFARTIYDELIKHDSANPPFNRVISISKLGAPHWRECDDFDIRAHVFLHRLDSPGSRQQLYQLIGDMHTERMPRDRPIWEFHIIDGMEKNHFAIYTKMHHAYADGVTMSSWIVRALSDSPRTRKVTPVWKIPGPRSSKSGSRGIPLGSVLKLTVSRYRDQLRMISGLTKLSTQLVLEQLHLTRNAVAVPFRANHNTPLTGQVTAGRQVATARVPMERVNRIRRITRSTLNHVALTCVDGALHRYLEDCGADLEGPITIQMPVNLRQQGDTDVGNKIGIVLVELARKTADPYERLREIGFTLRNVRYQVDGVPASSVAAYTVLLGVFAQLAETLKLSNVIPPIGNTLVSNVPGPSKPLYLKGAELQEMYPISALTPSNHMNITLYSYAGFLHFGMVATRSLPQLSKLGDYIHAAFSELEDAVLQH